MKKLVRFFKVPILAIIILMASGFASYKIIEAQETPRNTISNVVTLNMKQLTQDPRTHEITMLLAIDSKVETDRAKVTWTIPKYINFQGETTSFIPVTPGTPSIIEVKFTPNQLGKHKIEVSVEIIKADVNYVSSGTQEITINANLDVLPQGPNFQTYQGFYTTRDMFKTGAILFTVIGIVIIIVTTFIRWLNAEDSPKEK
jgi:hypothetical protein